MSEATPPDSNPRDSNHWTSKRTEPYTDAMYQGSLVTRLAGGALAAAAVALLCLPAAAQNVVPNANFDTSDVTAWTVYPNLSLQQVPGADAFGNPASGSGHVVNSASTPYNAGPSACFPSSVTGGSLYDWGATVRVPSGQTATGQAYVYVYWYSTAGCVSGWIQADGSSVVAADGAWHLTTVTNFAAPAAAQSVAVYLQVYKDVAGGTFEA